MAGSESEESDILMQRCGLIPKPNDASKVDGCSVAMMEEQSRKQAVGGQGRYRGGNEFIGKTWSHQQIACWEGAIHSLHHFIDLPSTRK